MNKKRIILIVIYVVLILVAAALIFNLFSLPKLTKDVEFKGYKITVPENWSNDSKGNLYDKQGYQVGNFTLANSEKKQEIYSSPVEITKNIIKYEEFLSDSIPSKLYVAQNLPNPEPYSAQIVLYDEYVNEKLADEIAKTFTIPKFGANPPEKNIKTPNEENSFVKIKLEDDGEILKNSNLLLEFLNKQSAKEDFGINVITYKEKDEKIELSSWKYLESDKGVGYLYTYYEAENGLYTYDNDALEFLELSKTVSVEEQLTSYFLIAKNDKKIELVDLLPEKEIDNVIIEEEKEETVEEFVQKVEEIGINRTDGDVVYSGSVVISYDTMITHPKTGKRVKIGPYAEERGYGAYLGKTITCVIKRAGSGYIATASSGGKTIMSYPLEDEAKLNWAKNIINSYS